MNDLIKELADCLESVLSEVDFEFGGWGDESVLEEDEPDHYVIKARDLIAKARQLERLITKHT